LGHLTILFKYIDYLATSDGTVVVDGLARCGIKSSCSVLMHSPRIFMEGLRKTTEILFQNS
jgi:hypothetical protein